MGGQQFSFFLGLTDQIHLEEVIRSSGEIVFLGDRSHCDSAEEIISSVMRSPSEDSFRILIARREDFPNIKFHPTGFGGEFSCNILTEPVVEFDRFFLFKKFVRAGRLYRVDKYWNSNNELIYKSPEFIQWAKVLYRVVKKSLVKIEQGCYAGQDACAMRRAGVPFEGIDIEFNSIEE